MIQTNPSKVTILGTYSRFFSLHGRCVGLGSGVLWYVPVIYGEAGLVSRELVSHGTVG